MRSFLLLLTIATATAMAPVARARGALDRFEQAHRPVEQLRAPAVRLGPRQLYQGQVQRFWGPPAALVGRL